MKSYSKERVTDVNGININMRCIEINYDIQRTAPKTININMRCIEIHLLLIWWAEYLQININMRCIEIFYDYMEH